MSDRSRRRGSAGGNTDPVARYLGTFERLRSRKRWSTNTATFRFVALALGTAGASVTYDHLESAAEVLRKRARATSPLRSEIRYVVAAMILRRGQDPGAIQARVRETPRRVQGARAPEARRRSHLGGATAGAAQGGPSGPACADRTARPHLQPPARPITSLLTSANDLPAAALHAGQDNSVEILTAQVDRAYDRLREAGFRRGNPLQLVSHLLSVDPRGTDTGVQRFSRVADHLGRAGEPVRSSRYDEIAMLALTHETPVPRGRPHIAVQRSSPGREAPACEGVGILPGCRDRVGRGCRGRGQAQHRRPGRAAVDQSDPGCAAGGSRGRGLRCRGDRLMARDPSPHCIA